MVTLAFDHTIQVFQFDDSSHRKNYCIDTNAYKASNYIMDTVINDSDGSI